MKKATYAEYAAAVDSLRQRHSRVDTNNFIPADKFKEMFENGSSRVVEAPGCILAAVLEHNSLYRLYYYAEMKSGLGEGLRLAEELYDKKLPAVCTVIGKQDYVEKVMPVFYDEGYFLRRRIRRFDSGNTRAVVVPDTDSTAEFARGDDAEEISGMLLSYFDIYSEQVPTVSEIRANAEKEHIVVVRQEDKIAALTYFNISNGQIHYIFNYVRPEYRKSLIFFELGPFIRRSLEEKGVLINREYGWRDIDNKKLNRVSAKQGDVAQDLVLYTVINAFGKDIETAER